MSKPSIFFIKKCGPATKKKKYFFLDVFFSGSYGYYSSSTPEARRFDVAALLSEEVNRKQSRGQNRPKNKKKLYEVPEEEVFVISRRDLFRDLE